MSLLGNQKFFYPSIALRIILGPWFDLAHHSELVEESNGLTLRFCLPDPSFWEPGKVESIKVRKNSNMFTKTTQLITIFLDNVLIFQTKIYGLVKRNAKKISALSMASKMLVLTAFFAVIPMVNTSTPQKYNTEIKFDGNSQLAIVPANKTVSLALGESEVDRAEREKREAEAQAKLAAGYVTKVSYHNDPSEFRPIYMAAGARFGIPWQLIEAVHEVESGKSGSTSKSSGAGATGPMQFMPGTWRAYGVDGNGDGVADVTDVVDAIYGAANLLAQSGAADGNIDAALLNYNHAMWYVNKVKAIAYEIGM